MRCASMRSLTFCCILRVGCVILHSLRANLPNRFFHVHSLRQLKWSDSALISILLEHACQNQIKKTCVPAHTNHLPSYLYQSSQVRMVLLWTQVGQISTFLSDIRAKSKSPAIIIAGDFNICSRGTKDDGSGYKMLKSSFHPLKDLYDGDEIAPTRRPNTKPWMRGALHVADSQRVYVFWCMYVCVCVWFMVKVADSKA